MVEFTDFGFEGGGVEEDEVTDSCGFQDSVEAFAADAKDWFVGRQGIRAKGADAAVGFYEEGEARYGWSGFDGVWKPGRVDI